MRARWKIEDLARGQWQLVVTELPHGTSAQKVLEEIEELSNPKVKAGKKTLSAEQLQLKAGLLSVLDGADVVYLAARNGARPLGLAFAKGMRLPAHLAATGRAKGMLWPMHRLYRSVAA